MTPTPAPLPQPKFDQFYKHAELTTLLKEFAEARPDLLELRELGRSHEGRPIWLLVITRKSTGIDEDKPGFWVDGNIHAAELTASTACLYWLDQLVRQDGNDAQVTELLSTRVIYLVPRLNPDGAELAMAERPRHIRSSTRPYPWDEAPVDGLTVEDMDGDGRILMMRIQDPHGGWKVNPDEPRLLTPRLPGEFGGVYYRVIPEGSLQHFDGITIKPNPDIEGL
ncbi:MAG: carboxypeptidase, partial [Betaproteobacteria bacterium]|nr:carboxypeptidase [Betaproteobacteria bacterium]